MAGTDKTQEVETKIITYFTFRKSLIACRSIVIYEENSYLITCKPHRIRKKKNFHGRKKNRKHFVHVFHQIKNVEKKHRERDKRRLKRNTEKEEEENPKWITKMVQQQW